MLPATLQSLNMLAVASSIKVFKKNPKARGRILQALRNLAQAISDGTKLAENYPQFAHDVFGIAA